jgi:hypothetical protein
MPEKLKVTTQHHSHLPLLLALLPHGPEQMDQASLDHKQGGRTLRPSLGWLRKKNQDSDLCALSPFCPFPREP